MSKQQSGAFVFRANRSLVAMEPTQFKRESELQSLLAQFPELLVGDQIDPEFPRRWALVKRELSVSTAEDGGVTWSIDHVFLDQDAVPTLVEVKRGANPENRRKVVGQMLDYAANFAAHWPASKLRATFEQGCQSTERSSEKVLAELINSNGDFEESEDSVEQYWKNVQKNLDEGRLRLLFVADEIPIELRRVVEFLNKQMSKTEVLAIELRRYRGEGIETIIPMVFGQTQETRDRRNANSAKHDWNENTFFETLARDASPSEVDLARHIFNWMRHGGREIAYGSGRNGSISVVLRPHGVRIVPLYLSTNGKLYIQFGALVGKPVFGSVEARRELMHLFASIAGVVLTDAQLEKYPGILLNKIASDPQGLLKLDKALSWIDTKLVDAPSP